MLEGESGLVINPLKRSLRTRIGRVRRHMVHRINNAPLAPSCHASWQQRTPGPHSGTHLPSTVVPVKARSVPAWHQQGGKGVCKENRQAISMALLTPTTPNHLQP